MSKRQATRSASGTIIAVAVIGAAATALAAVLVGIARDHLAAPGHARGSQETAALLSRAAASHVNEQQATLETFAGRPQLGAAIGAGDRARLAELADLFRAAFPDALRLLIVPETGIEPAPRADPPIGYALVEQIDRALNGGGASTELHLAGKPQAHINTVAPIRAQGGISGALVLSHPSTALSEVIAPPGNGTVTLEQSVGGQSARVLVLGNKRDNEAAWAQAGVAGTPWRLNYSAPPEPGALGGANLLIIAGVAGAGVLAILLIGAVAAHRLRTALSETGSRFVELFGDFARGNVSSSYTSSVHELAEPLDRCLARARDTGAPAAGVDTPTAPSPAAAEEYDLDPEPTDHAPEPAEETPQEPPAPETAAQATRIDPSILRAYDIRGVVGETLTPEVAAALGRAIGSEAIARGHTRVVVGYDGRDSSPELALAVVSGLTDAGCEAIDIGRVTTPMVYFATHHLETHCGIAVTGSHNPPEYNGLKIVVGGETLWGDAIQALGRRVAEGDLASGEGSMTREDVREAYISTVVSDITVHRPLQVVVDAGNGVAGELAPELYDRLACHVEPLFCEVDGNFPNHHPDPTVPENLETLIETVTARGADLGLAFDGDGDRLGVVDDQGNIIWADRQMMLYATDILTRNPGSDIIFDVKCTSHLARVITENAGVPLMWKTGHSLIKDKLRETGAPLAGEMSGHLFFNDRWYGFDDGVYAGARLLEILSMDQRPASAVFAELPTGVSTPEIRVDLEEGEPPLVIDALLAESEAMEGARVTTIDGLRVDFPDGWGLVRSSNTQPCLVMRFEGDDQAALERIRELFRERLERVCPGVELPF